MSLSTMRWFAGHGYDVHLIPGLATPPLDQFLLIHDKDGASFPGNDPPPDITVKVTHNVRDVVAPDDFGFRILTGGAVFLPNPWPAPGPDTPRLRSFIVTFTATDGTKTEVVRLRVHLHQSLAKIWLTPSPLTVRDGTTTVRHTVLARFDDGVTGDISNWANQPLEEQDDKITGFYYEHQADPNADIEPILKFTSNSPLIKVDNESGELFGHDPAAPAVTISVSLAALSPVTGTGLAQGAPFWNAPFSANLLKGPGLDPTDPTVHNVLFLPDGFEAAELPDFERLARQIVDRFVDRTALSPFDILNTNHRLNYFMAGVPSPAGGHSVLPEVVLTNIVDADFDAAFVPLPDFTPTSHPIDLPRLIAKVGLPVPTDPPGLDMLGMISRWSKQYKDPPSEADLSTPVFASWVALRQRTLFDEIDTAFSIASGERPHVDRPLPPIALRLHPRRGADQNDDDASKLSNLDILLNSLTDQTGTAVHAWTWQKPNPPNDNGLPSSGSRLVLFVCRSLTLGASNSRRLAGTSARYAGITLGSGPTVAGHPSTNGVTPVVDPIPGSAGIFHWMTAARELARSFHIYSEQGGQFNTFDESHFRDAPDLAMNIQLASELTKPNVGLMADDLIWNAHPRVVRAGLLTVAPAGPAGGPWMLTFQTGHGKPFAVNDVVKLRQRELDSTVEYSPLLTITAKPTDDSAIVEVTGAGSRLTADLLRPNEVVILPLRGTPTSGSALGPEITLVAPITIDRINQSHNPLNVEFGADPNQPCDDFRPLSTPTMPLNFPKTVKLPRFSFDVIGLYDNGAGCNCGVYRPTGGCIMSNPYEVGESVDFGFALDFCLVCAYAIIDGVDPRLLPLLNPLFAKSDPK